MRPSRVSTGDNRTCLVGHSRVSLSGTPRSQIKFCWDKRLILRSSVLRDTRTPWTDLNSLDLCEGLVAPRPRLSVTQQRVKINSVSLVFPPRAERADRSASGFRTPASKRTPQLALAVRIPSGSPPARPELSDPHVGVQVCQRGPAGPTHTGVSCMLASTCYVLCVQ